jgi:hypothetical protein
VETQRGSEPRLPPSREGSVVLDIGADRGAAVILTPPSLDGMEIEIRPVDAPWAGWHTGVRRRDLPAGPCFAAVFGSIPAGHYQLRVRGTGSEAVLTLAVTGGHITEESWPAGP